jgi:hypothetical protein
MSKVQPAHKLVFDDRGGADRRFADEECSRCDAKHQAVCLFQTDEGLVAGRDGFRAHGTRYRVGMELLDRAAKELEKSLEGHTSVGPLARGIAWPNGRA